MENVLTRNGIWAAGFAGFAAVVAFCLMHHAPSNTSAIIASSTIKTGAPTPANSPAASAPAPAIVAAPAAVNLPAIALPGQAINPPALTPPALIPPTTAALNRAASNLTQNAATTPAAQVAAPRKAAKPAVTFKKKRLSKLMIAKRKLLQVKAQAKAEAQE